jgi:hypothetical protein
MSKVVFAAGATEVMELKLPNPEKNFKLGENILRLEVTDLCAISLNFTLSVIIQLAYFANPCKANTSPMMIW